MLLIKLPSRLERGPGCHAPPRRAPVLRARAFALLAMLAELPASAGHAQLIFGPRTDYLAGSGPSAVAIGDLNGDGQLDFVVANSSGNNVNTYFRNPDGSFGAVFFGATGHSPAHVALADLDGDGILDVVTADQIDNSLSFLRGRGDGSLFPRSIIPAGTNPVFVAIGDLNGDGRPDLVVANSSHSTVSVIKNLGGGAFSAPTTYAVNLFSVGAAIGRLNADSYPDVAVAQPGPNVRVFPGNGDGTLGTRTDVPVANGPAAVAIADVNGDGRQDLVVASSNTNILSVRLGNGDGTFGDLVQYPTGTYPRSMVAADLTGDGALDVVTANYNSNTLSLFVGNGQGGLDALSPLSTGSLPNSVAAGDLDGDGLPDLIVANFGSNTVSVYLQTPSPPLIRVLPASLPFGFVFVGATETLSVRVQNIGSQPLTISNAAVAGAGFSTTAVTPFTLGRGEYRDLMVQFDPGAPGSYSGTLTIDSDDATHPVVTVPLSGSADYRPVAELSPSSLSLAASAGARDSSVLDLRNTGQGTLTYSLATVGPQPSWLTFAPTGGGVAAGDSVQVKVLADALALFDGKYSAVLRVTTNDSQRPQIDVPITFAVTGTPRIAVTPASIDYGTGYLGVTGSRGVTVSNTGTDTLLVTAMTTDSPEFVVSGTTVFMLPPTAQSTLQVVYRRQVEGTTKATLSVQSNDASNPTVTVSLMGSAVDPPHIVVAPDSLPHVVVSVGDSTFQSLTISNTSHASRLDVNLAVAPVSGLSATPPFGVSPASGSIDPGQQSQFQVVYRGVNRPFQDLTSTLSVSSNDPAIPLVTRALALHILGVPHIGLSPDTLAFGIGFVGVPETMLLTVSSVGSDTLRVSGIVSSNPQFSLLDPTSFALAAGAARQIRVYFARSAAGDLDEQLTISSNDPGRPTATVRLLGSAHEPPVVQVSPTSIDVAVMLGDSTVVPLSIRNVGHDSLVFAMNVRRPPPPAPAAALELGAEAVYSSADPDPALARVPAEDTRPIPHGDASPHTLSATRILVIGDGGTETDVVPILEGAGYQVTLVADDAVWDGTNPAPDVFGAVVLLDGIDFGDDMPAAGQLALLDFVRGGGGVVVSEWLSYEVSQGRYAQMRPLVPITRTTGVTGALNYSVVAAHQVTAGVSPTFQVTAAVTKGVLNSGTVVVKLSTGEPAVVVKDEGLGRVAALAVAGNYNGRRPFLSTDMRLLLLNSVAWASGFRWLSYDPRAGTVAAGGKGVVNVKLTTAGLGLGEEVAQLLLDSNDPTTPELVVPVRLRVLNHPVSVQAALVSQEVEADRVRLTWQVTRWAVATVYRNDGGANWRALREVTADGSGLLAFEDDDVGPGARYGYRLGVQESGAESLVGEAWVQTPAAVLALNRVWPTPTARDMTVSFSLPDRRGGRFGLYDVNGRRWMEVALERLGPGPHEVRLEPLASVPPGLYWLRLTSGERSLTTRVVLLR